MDWLELLSAGFVGLTVSFMLIVLILQGNRRFNWTRTNEAHHTHKTPVPRLGGIALAGSMVVVVMMFSLILGPAFLLNNDRSIVIISSLAMFALGLWDDLFALGARRKLLGQVAIASLTYFSGIGIMQFKIPITFQVIDLGIWAFPVTVFWLVAMTNLINLIDGVDGLAGGICLMLMVLFLFVSLHSGLVPLLTAGLAGALLAFLYFNFPPARIYMGDGGAYFLGFYIGVSTIVTSQKGTIVAALMAPLFVLALPIIDTSLAILRRGIKGLPLFRPDRKHIHHRLLAAGHSRRKVVLGLYLFTAFFLVLGFATFFWHGAYFPLFLGLGVFVILMVAFKFSFSREWFSVGRVLGNSLESRADIQYAMSLSRWLALEGPRVESIDELAQDVVFIARKLGFDCVRIRLEDEEKTWQLNNTAADKCEFFRHHIPGHKYCFLELGVASPKFDESDAKGAVKQSKSVADILADLVAEGWAKAIADWKKRNQLPTRFDARPQSAATAQTSLKNLSESIKPN